MDRSVSEIVSIVVEVLRATAHQPAVTNPSTPPESVQSPAGGSFWVIGKPYFIRTVTHHFIGRLVRIEGPLAILDNCAWIPDDGRFNETMKNGTVNEVEPYLETMQVAINTASLIDAVQWPHKLLLGVK